MYTKPKADPGANPLSLRRRRRRCGMTLVELLVAVGLGGIVLAVIMVVMLFSARSFAALVNYVDLDNFSRGALDEMTWEIRQADELAEGSSNRMVFRFSNPISGAALPMVSYVYNPNTRELVRTDQAGNRKVLLEECDYLEFQFYRRNPVTNSFNLFVTAPQPLVDPGVCKAVQMKWICSRSVMQAAVNTESVQSARVVIRKK